MTLQFVLHFNSGRIALVSVTKDGVHPLQFLELVVCIFCRVLVWVQSKSQLPISFLYLILNRDNTLQNSIDSSLAHASCTILFLSSIGLLRRAHGNQNCPVICEFLNATFDKPSSPQLLSTRSAIRWARVFYLLSLSNLQHN